MGRVKRGLPLTPTTVAAPGGTRDRHLVVMGTGKTDYVPSALPRRVTAC